MRTGIVLLLLGGFLAGVVLADDEVLSMLKLDDKINTFLKNNRYPGVVLGVKIDDKLAYLRSYGNNSDGSTLKVSDLLPISSLSKTLTAVAIMKLVEEGKLNLSKPVFGKDGVLWMIKPLKGAKLDTRLHLITVDHLLRHTAGWKQNSGPLYDPMLNRFYVLRGYHVPDIAREMNVKGYLLPSHMIRYVMSQKLDYSPGTEYHYYNLGYSMLGRIIEEITGMGYEEYIRETILIPAGMWQTRIGPHKPDKLAFPTQPATVKPIPLGGHYKNLDIEDVVHPDVLDSTLGWHSTMADVMRFMSFLDGTSKTQLLNQKRVLSMLTKPSQPFAQHVEKWTAAGFTAKNDGSFWQVADEQFNDMIFYNDGINRPVTNRIDKEFARGPKKLSFAFIFTGNRYKHIKHSVKRMIKEVSVWSKQDNFFTADLIDMKTDIKGIKSISKFKLPEPHLSAYSNAMKSQGYVPKWISAYQHEKKTYFATIFIKGVGEKRLQKQSLNFKNDNRQDFMVLHGLTSRKLRKHLHKHYDYHLSFVQSYVSSSHDQSLCNVAVLTKGKRRVKHGFTKKLSLFENLTNKLHKRKYMPTVQSIETKANKEVVSYILQKVKQNRYKAVHDLSMEELQNNIKTNGVENKNLIYLDSYLVHGKTKFSAIFSFEKNNGWLLLNSVTPEQVQTKTLELQATGYTPQIIVGYEENEKLMFATLWKRY